MPKTTSYLQMQIHILRTIGQLPLAFPPSLSTLFSRKSFKVPCILFIAKHFSLHIRLDKCFRNSCSTILRFLFIVSKTLIVKVFWGQIKQYCKNLSCTLQNKNEWAINVCICVWRTFTFARYVEARQMFHYQSKLTKYLDNVFANPHVYGATFKEGLDIL